MLLSNSLPTPIGLASLITEYGVLTVLAGVFIWFSIKQYRRNDKILQQALNRLFDEQAKKEQDHDIRLASRFQTANMIQSILRAAQEDCDVDSAFVIEFHNSVMNVAGVPFAKCTITYETSRHYTNNAILPLIQNLPISIFSGLILDMPKNDTQCYSITELMTTNSVLYSLLTPTVSTIYATKLVSNGQMIGLLISTRHRERSSQSSIEIAEMSKKLHHHGTTISGLICIDK